MLPRSRVALLLVVLAVTACTSATTHIKGDDDVVVRSVQAERILFNTADTLFNTEFMLEQQGYPLYPPITDLKSFTDTKRLEVPRLLVTLRTMTRIYRQTVVGPKPDINEVVARAETVADELRVKLIVVAVAKTVSPPPPHDRLAATTGNPYVDAAIQLLQLLQTGLTLYEEGKAKAASNGVLIDADENLLHVREDTALVSPAWQR